MRCSEIYGTRLTFRTREHKRCFRGQTTFTVPGGYSAGRIWCSSTARCASAATTGSSTIVFGAGLTGGDAVLRQSSSEPTQRRAVRRLLMRHRDGTVVGASTYHR